MFINLFLKNFSRKSIIEKLFSSFFDEKTHFFKKRSEILQFLRRQTRKIPFFIKFRLPLFVEFCLTPKYRKE